MGYRSNISHQVRGFFYADSGGDTLDGKSIEHPKKTIQAALDGASGLIPTPSPSSIGFVNEAQGGVYVEDLTLYDSVLFEGQHTTIVSTGLVGVSGANSLSFKPQTLVNNTDNATVLEVDALSSFGTTMSGLIVGGDNGLGVEIKNNCDSIFFTISQLQLRGDGSKGVMVTGDCATPIDFNFNTVSFSNNNATFFDYNPLSPVNVADVNISSLFNASGVAYTGTTGLLVQNGILKVRAGSIAAGTAANVQANGILTVSANTVAGSTIVTDGSCIYDTVGVVFGNMTVSGVGVLQHRGSTVFGSVESSGNSDLALHCNQLQGDLTIGAGTRAFVVIGSMTGTLTVNGTLNGVIGGKHYGDWVQGRTKVLELVGDATTSSVYTTSPQTALSEVINVDYDRAEISFSFESSNSTANRSTVVGLFVNGVLQGLESDIEQKDANNHSYQCKNVDTPLLIGNNTIEVKYGVGNGPGGALATVSDILILVKEMII